MTRYTPFRPPTPWGTGLLVSLFSTVVVATAAIVFASQLARVSVVLAVVLNVIVGVGVVLTVWHWRTRPTWRWVVYGICAGIPVGWVAALAGAS
ncbi:DUF2537 domain-containing protein [Rhodococcus triatomae]|uniref:DUF2537 domain-containing protein n=1 Tax=Rhodococcus triatomae TaxID=300028 RepID=A0A1G8ASI4_9NOCA|nr:DUF2537 domain-containing protein [Rhodococcus triatomae]QNG17687.1 DUF2537 domain-containing protein [Rhodococcus triatomae]QNG22645.1 DUF2537 domain-containing protein [Rhodococcus triatomae]SDH23686.1 Protein of unknown function [Rhodococcus triatomae]